jgi:autotransporter-associated beta strand protein
MRRITWPTAMLLTACVAGAAQATTTPMDFGFDADPSVFSLGAGDTLLGVQNITTSRDISLDGLSTIDTAGYTVEFVGVLSGANGFEKTGSGTLIFSTNATFAGPVTVSDGVLQIGNGASVGTLTADIVDNTQVVFDYSGSNDYIGSMTGTGSLLLSGTGTAIFEGSLAMTGGATIASGTMQIGNGGATGSISGAIVDDGALVVNRTGIWTLSSDITGTGTFMVTGGGTTILTGAAAMTGGTTIDTLTTLQIGGGGMAGTLTGGIVDNGTLAFQHSDAVTFATAVSGTGGLHQLGTGMLTLTATNTFTGDTVIDAGSTLQIGNGGTTGSAESTVFVDNGTLVFNRSDAVTFAGDIQGAGAVTKAGTNTLTLNGNTTGTGTITVDSGTLTVGDSTHSSASVGGSVTVAAGGTMNGFGSVLGTLTNNGTVTLAGNAGAFHAGIFTQNTAGTLKLDIAPASSDILHVTGTATLGGTLALTSASGTYGTTTITLLDAAHVSGGFTALTGAPLGEAAALVYSGTAVTLSLTPQAPAQMFSDVEQTAFAIDRAIGDALLDRIFAHRCGVRRCNSFQLWLQTYSGLSNTNAESTTIPGFSAHGTGLIGGIDYLAGGGTSMGLFGGYQSGRMSVSGGAGSAAISSYVVGLSAGTQIYGVRLDANYRYVVNNADTSRTVTTSGGVLTAAASPRASISAGAVQFTVPVNRGVAAFLRVSYSSLSQSAFGESGAGNYDFVVDRTGHSAGFADLGFRFASIFALSDGMALAPDISSGLRVPLGSPSEALRVGLASDALAQRFASQGPNRNETGGFASLGLVVNGRGGLSLALRANGEAASGRSWATLSFGGSIRF